MIKYLKNKKGNSAMYIFLMMNITLCIFLILMTLLPNVIGLFSSTFNTLNGSDSTQVEQNLIVK